MPTIWVPAIVTPCAEASCLHGFVGLAQRGLLEIGEVHGDLHLVAAGQRDSHGFQRRQATGGGADFARDRLGDGKIGGVEIHVEGDQEVSGADDAGSRAWMQCGSA